MSEKNSIILAYNNLLAAGKVTNKADFANQLDINPSSLSRAMNGDARYLTRSLMDRIRYRFPSVSFSVKGEDEQKVPPPTLPQQSTDIAVITQRFVSLLEKKDEQMDKLIDIIATQNESKNK